MKVAFTAILALVYSLLAPTILPSQPFTDESQRLIGVPQTAVSVNSTDAEEFLLPLRPANEKPETWTIAQELAGADPVVTAAREAIEVLWGNRRPAGLPVFTYLQPDAGILDAPIEAAPAPVERTAAQADEPAAALVVEQPAEDLAGAQVAADRQLTDFSATVVNGQAGQVVGVYVPGVLAIPVVQQPTGQAGYVSNQDGVITQFSLPSGHGTVGLLAHNYLSGELFFDLEENQEVMLVHGDGHLERYRISVIRRFQALSPNSVYSEFIDLADPSQKVISSTTLFSQVYTTPGQVVFQTCIEANGNPSWGRIFVTAERVE